MIQEFLELGIEIKSNHPSQKVKCPKCSYQRKKKNDPSLSVNLEKGLYNCHHCGWQGNVNLKPKVEYVKPPESKTELNDSIISFFNDRGISESTLAYWKIGKADQWLPQVNEQRGCIAFNYYRDNELINVKYRDREKNFKLVKGAELIFYGLDNIKDSEVIYITEGEIDALSLHEVGIFSVVSVPNGASKGNQKLDYLDNCYKYFEEPKKVIICTDNDEAGVTLREELARRFGKHRSSYVDFGEFKDANEVLLKQGAKALREFLDNPKEFPLEGIVDIDSIWDNVLQANEKGIPDYDLGYASEKFRIAMGEWTVCTGVPNSGKSDFVDQIAVNLATREKFKTAFFSPESFPYEGHIRRLANKLNEANCNNDQLNNSKDFIKEYFHFVKIDLENVSIDSILNKFKELVFRKGVNLLVIDPWNMLDHSEQKDNSYIGKKLSKITQFVQRTNTHLFLVAHPRKLEKNANGYVVPTPYDISGSSDFFNKAFNCITIWRDLMVKSNFGSDMIEVHIQKVKRKEHGEQGSFNIAPDFSRGGAYFGVDPDSGSSKTPDYPQHLTYEDNVF